MSVVDLGCGTGELTQVLHRQLQAKDTLGIDSSSAMLEKAAAYSEHGLRFSLGDIAGFRPENRVDLIFSSAALQWVLGHRELFARLTEALHPGGQLAVQLPANFGHASYVVAQELAESSPFKEALSSRQGNQVLSPVEYAALLHQLGYVDRHVRVQVYGHEVASRDMVFAWAKGALLTGYASRLGTDLYARFEAEYRQRLLDRLADERPFLFTFKRILIRAIRPSR